MYDVDWWSGLDGEQFLDDQEYYFEPDQQYNMGLSLLPIHYSQ
jgi:hypothetical protein